MSISLYPYYNPMVGLDTPLIFFTVEPDRQSLYSLFISNA
jgi:hypothetical protein